MSIGLTWPAALLGAVALLLPLLIHLLPRRQSLLRPFAALRFVGQHAAPRRQRRISEWLLLLLRLALLTLLLLWLAGPVWRDWPGLGLHWRAVWPGVSVDALATQESSADRSVWLRPGFPYLQQDIPDIEFNSGSSSFATEHVNEMNTTASLLRELAASLPPGDRLSVVVPAELEGLDADALALAREVGWQILPSDPTASGAAAKPRRLALRIEEDAQTGRWLDAALLAWDSDPTLTVELDRGGPEQLIPAETSALLWLGDSPAPRWQGATRPLLQVPNQLQAHIPIGDPLSRLRWSALTAGGARLAGPLTPKATPEVLDPDFPQRLHRALFNRQPTPQRAPAESLRPRVDESAMSPSSLDLREWLALLIVLLLLVERWLASGTRLTLASAARRDASTVGQSNTPSQGAASGSAQ